LGRRGRLLPAGRAHDLDRAQGGDPDRTPAREDRHQRRDPDHGIAARRRGGGNFRERHRGAAARAGKVKLGDLLFLRAALALLTAAAIPASAQPYPSKPVKLVVSSAAGGSPDLQARLYTQRMTQLYGYIWVIENLPGAGANIAPERVAKAPPDGYTLLMASAGPLYFNPTLYTKLPYDIQRDFEPITQVSNVPNILAVHPSVPLRSVKELIAYARANPGKLRLGSPGAHLKKRWTSLRSVLNSAAVGEQYAANGMIAGGSGSAEFAAYMKSEIARWAPLIRATGATVD